MRSRQMLFFPPLIVGLAVFYALRQFGAEAQDASPPPAPLPVRVATLERVDFAASAVGFGRVEAERDWQAISQVEGRVISLIKGLAIGKIARKADLLVEIDPRDYQIAKAKAEANLASAEASLEEVAVEEANTRRLLEIEQRIETVRDTDFKRQTDLQSRGTASQTALDEAERALLAQQKVVQDIENQLALIPVQRISLEATISTRRVELEEAQRDLDNTKIAAPFTGRAAETDVAEGQYVRTGDVLLKLEDVATAEIVAEFQPNDLRGVILSQDAKLLERLITDRGSAEAGARVAALGFTATVHAQFGEERFSWPAEITRVTGRVDDVTGAFGVVVRVQKPARPDIASRRPPLNVGAFVEVRLTAPEREMLLAPRTAIRADLGGAPFVYLMDQERSLRRAAVTLGPVYEDQVEIKGGVEPGAAVVLSNVDPAVLGMPLDPIDAASRPAPAAPAAPDDAAADPTR